MLLLIVESGRVGSRACCLENSCITAKRSSCWLPLLVQAIENCRTSASVIASRRAIQLSAILFISLKNHGHLSSIPPVLPFDICINLKSMSLVLLRETTAHPFGDKAECNPTESKRSSNR